MAVSTFAGPKLFGFLLKFFSISQNLRFVWESSANTHTPFYTSKTLRAFTSYQTSTAGSLDAVRRFPGFPDHMSPDCTVQLPHPSGSLLHMSISTRGLLPGMNLLLSSNANVGKTPCARAVKTFPSCARQTLSCSISHFPHPPHPSLTPTT